MRRLYAILIAAGALTALCAGCRATAILPLLQRDTSDTIELTSDYEWRDDTGRLVLCPVNPEGLGLKLSRKLADGTIELMLGGTLVRNGVPEALHRIPYPQGVPFASVPTGNALTTDCVVGEDSREYPPAADELRPLEDSIKLGRVSENSKYTMVTISGMVPHGSYVHVKEENESLRLLTERYLTDFNKTALVYKESAVPMIKDAVYHEDPNFFSDNGLVAPKLIYRGNETQRGGFNLLIWDGADPKRAVYTIQANKGPSITKVIVDWSNVRYVEVPLQKVLWQDTLPKTVTSAYRPIHLVSTAHPAGYAAEAIIQEYSTADAVRPNKSVAEGLSPQFMPENAANKNFYFRTVDGHIINRSYYETDHVRFELADRVRVLAIGGAGITSNPERVTICINAPLDAESNQGVVEIELSVEVIPLI